MQRFGLRIGPTRISSPRLPGVPGVDLQMGPIARVLSAEDCERLHLAFGLVHDAAALHPGHGHWHPEPVLQRFEANHLASCGVCFLNWESPRRGIPWYRNRPQHYLTPSFPFPATCVSAFAPWTSFWGRPPFLGPRNSFG